MTLHGKDVIKLGLWKELPDMDYVGGALTARDTCSSVRGRCEGFPTHRGDRDVEAQPPETNQKEQIAYYSLRRGKPESPALPCPALPTVFWGSPELSLCGPKTNPGTTSRMPTEEECLSLLCWSDVSWRHHSMSIWHQGWPNQALLV